MAGSLYQNCKYRENELNWDKDPIEQNNLMNKCIGFLINELITQLKNIYQNSYIIIKGDHGKPNGYYLEGSIESQV